MAFPWWIIPTAISAAGAYAQYKGQKKQGKARAEGFETQQLGVDFQLASFMQQLQASQVGMAQQYAQQQMQSRAIIQSANFNAAIAKENAEIAREQARAEAIQVNRNNVLRLGSLRAAAGASGVSYEGSVTDVVGDVVAQGELARQNVLYLGELQARGENITAYLESLRARAAYSAASMNTEFLGQQAALTRQQAALAMEAAEYEKYALRRRAGAERKGAQLGASATLLSGASQAFSYADRFGAFS